MNKYIKLEEYNILFKHLISGPAPVGRILNYVKLAGKGELLHKNGFRFITLQDNIGSAWCTEFMVGLNLITYDSDSDEKVKKVYLTLAGEELFDSLENTQIKFDESINPLICKKQLVENNKQAYSIFWKIFINSPVYKNLLFFIKEKNTFTFSTKDFRDDYYEYFLKMYDETASYSRESRTSTGKNRVPSLLQLCEFFELVKEEDDKFIFNSKKMIVDDGQKTFIDINKIDVKQRLAKEKAAEEIVVSDLISKYGIDGTTARKIVTRNSYLQKVFRNNLIAKYGCKCAICGKNIDEVLIASHIYESSKSNVYQKVDCENGLLLCALHDKLFDRHLITFDYKTGNLLYAPVLKDKLNDYQLTSDTKLQNDLLTKERKEYLKKHNEIFRNKNDL